jgi:hypothetical protein
VNNPDVGIVASCHARHPTEACAQCEKAFVLGDIRWRVPRRVVSSGRIRWEISLCCTACTPERRRSDRSVLACEHCGRLVGLLPGRRAFCSDRCIWSWHNAQRRARRSAERLAHRECSGCGKSFAPRRSDATTCGPATQRIRLNPLFTNQRSCKYMRPYAIFGNVKAGFATTLPMVPFKLSSRRIVCSRLVGIGRP